MARNVRADGRLDTGLVLVCLVLSLLALVSPRKTRDDVAGLLRTRILAPLVALEGRAAAVRAAVRTRSVVLTMRGRSLADTLSLRAIADENTTLRGLLGLSSRLQDGFVVAEILPVRPGSEFEITLNAGSAVGVQAFLPVVNGAGLVGMVERVDAQTSSAITWAHPDFRVSAMSVDQDAFGIVQPHLAADAERWLLEMRGVPFRATLDSGALIVSSGLGATYPRGIPVGTVIGELSTPEKWARTYLLKPAVLPDDIGPVLVLLPARATLGVNGVWTSVSAADSAARAVAAAGDSLARRAAFDELAARRAVFDSLGADSLRRIDTVGGPSPARPVANPRQRLDSVTRRDSVRGPATPARSVPPPAEGRW